MGFADLELVVESEGLHYKHEVHPFLCPFVQNRSKFLYPLVLNILLRHYLFYQLNQSAHLVGLIWINIFRFHHSSDSVQY